MSGQQRWDVGDRAGFVRCYRATVDDLYRFVAALPSVSTADAEDIVQDVYLIVLRKAVSGTLENVTLSYLKTAVRYRHLDVARAQARERARVELFNRDVARGGPRDVAEIDQAGLEGSLTERERTAINLRYVDDLPVSHVAASMGVSARTAESLITRARKRLRKRPRERA
jgi:RNA polymerase sigma factor (sigma-70 family)